MNISKIKLTPSQISGNAEGTGIVLSVSNGFQYIDGKKTDSLTHIKYETVFPENNYEKTVVKVAGTKPVLTNEMLQQKAGKANVRFKNLTGMFYRSNSGEYALSASADGIEVIQ